MRISIFNISINGLISFIDFSLNSHSSFISFLIRNNINISSEDISQSSSSRNNSLSLSSEDTNNLNSISRSYIINMLFKSNKLNVMRSFSIRNVFLIFLHLYMLFISKCRHVVDNGKTTFCLTIFAFVWLFNLLSIHRSKFSMIAVDTPEMSILDFRNDISTSNDDSFNLNEFINIIRTEVSLKTCHFEINWSDLNNCG